MTLNIFKLCHLGYLDLKIYSPIKFYQSYICISMISRKLKSFNGHVGSGRPVFEIVLSTLVDIRSTNELTFGGPVLIKADRRNM